MMGADTAPGDAEELRYGTLGQATVIVHLNDLALPRGEDAEVDVGEGVIHAPSMGQPQEK